MGHGAEKCTLEGMGWLGRGKLAGDMSVEWMVTVGGTVAARLRAQIPRGKVVREGVECVDGMGRTGATADVEDLIFWREGDATR